MGAYLAPRRRRRSVAVVALVSALVLLLPMADARSLRQRGESGDTWEATADADAAVEVVKGSSGPSVLPVTTRARDGSELSSDTVFAFGGSVNEIEAETGAAQSARDLKLESSASVSADREAVLTLPSAAPSTGTTSGMRCSVRPKRSANYEKERHKGDHDDDDDDDDDHGDDGSSNAGAHSNAVSNGDVDTDSSGDSNGDIDTDVNADTDADGKTEDKTGSSADGNGDTDADIGSDGNADGEANNSGESNGDGTAGGKFYNNGTIETVAATDKAPTVAWTSVPTLAALPPRPDAPDTTTKGWSSSIIANRATPGGRSGELSDESATDVLENSTKSASSNVTSTSFDQTLVVVIIGVVGTIASLLLVLSRKVLKATGDDDDDIDLEDSGFI
ncbi:unnamed protein product [Hyaloperonospora brassicae]|uniref:RxLR effector candidate protein n=1 Tax=Hyaloperonospora brassicae TaxID=162125 RepID=A0AAV0TWQ1_HYABA|nr:unnamed protein product [Hyaloperonospora brassicae]CAI5730860.1 unnamed protein product [Hyaloperonospora brassicae]